MKNPTSCVTDRVGVRRAIALACAALALLTFAGCNVVAPFAYLVEGPPKVPARHQLDPDRATVIFIDDLENNLPRRSLSDMTGRIAEETLLRQGIVSSDYLITNRAARQVAAADTSANRTSIVDVGRAVGAEVVVYVDIESFGLTAANAQLAPEARARVKVLDAASNERIWPTSDDGHPLVAQTNTRPEFAVISRDERYRIEEVLANELGTELARLFFEHERERLEDRRDRIGFGN